MALGPRLEIRQNQSLVMTPQLQQAIKLLQMSNLQLSDYVASLAEANPLLEAAGPPLRGGGGGADPASAIELAAETVTLRTHLLRQIGTARAPRPVVRAATALVDELEDDGYLRVPLTEVAERHGLAEDVLAEALALLQACDPAGVGARTLAECFALQLREIDALGPEIACLLAHLPALSGGVAALAEACGLPAPDVTALLARLRQLDPRPGARFGVEPVAVVVPDILVQRRGEAWDVELNPDTLPRVLVNNGYALRLGRSDPATRAFVSACSAQANWLVRSLEQRARTVLKVAGGIVQHQERFLQRGVVALQPLSRRALADRLGLHESTVSRVTAGKYLACELGVFELRFFFSQSIQAVEGGEAFSAAAVQERIRALIQSEAAPRPLSDDRLGAMLKAEGIDIARRTVAKYREAMGIPSSVDRRRLNLPLVGRPVRAGAALGRG